MPTRTSSAEWQGNLKDGAGTMRVGSGAYEGSYSFVSRFESGPGTNPEELIAAAHAGCFSMALSAALGTAGFTSTTRLDLDTVAAVPNLEDGQFQEIAAGAKANCPVSRALAAVEITLNARLEG